MDEKKKVAKQRPPKHPPTVKSELLRLFTKILVVVLIFVVLFNFVFGIQRTADNTMSPSIKNGDIVLYYRFDKHYVARDVVVITYEGKTQLRRVVAVAGDTVDITEDGLMINGSLQYEPEITKETLPYVEGIKFPVTLKEDEVFLLADDRKDSQDSRVYGPVNVENIKGKAISFFRRRGL